MGRFPVEALGCGAVEGGQGWRRSAREGGGQTTDTPGDVAPRCILTRPRVTWPSPRRRRTRQVAHLYLPDTHTHTYTRAPSLCSLTHVPSSPLPPVQVLPGAKVPTDGVIVDGQSYVNEAMVTGESVPKWKRPGDVVIGGTINTSNPLLVSEQVRDAGSWGRWWLAGCVAGAGCAAGADQEATWAPGCIIVRARSPGVAQRRAWLLPGCKLRFKCSVVPACGLCLRRVAPGPRHACGQRDGAEPDCAAGGARPDEQGARAGEQAGGAGVAGGGVLLLGVRGTLTCRAGGVGTGSHSKQVHGRKERPAKSYLQNLTTPHQTIPNGTPHITPARNYLPTNPPIRHTVP